MHKLLQQYGFTPSTLFQIILITANAQLIYAFWDIRNSIPKDFPAALGVTDAQAGQLYAMQGLVIILGTVALGWLGDRFKIRNIMLLSSLGVGGISLFITLASPGLGLPVLLLCFFAMLLFSEVLFKPANFKAIRVSTTEKHQGAAFGFFEFGRGLLAFLISLLWTLMLSCGASSKTIMVTSCAVVIGSGILVFFAVPKEQKVGENDQHTTSTLEALKGVGKVAKLPVVWLVGINAFCIYGTFVAAGTYFARFLQAGYGTSALAAAIFASTVTALRMLPLLSGFLVEKVFCSVAHFMRTLEICLMIVLIILGILFWVNHPQIISYSPDQPPTGLIAPFMFWLIVGLMLLACALCFMIRGVYYAPIGEFGVPKKHSSSAMSFAITIGYVPALLAPITLGALVTSPIKNSAGQVIKETLTDTRLLAEAFIGLAVLTLIAVTLSHLLVKKQPALK